MNKSASLPYHIDWSPRTSYCVDQLGPSKSTARTAITLFTVHNCLRRRIQQIIIHISVQKIIFTRKITFFSCYYYLLFKKTVHKLSDKHSVIKQLLRAVFSVVLVLESGLINRKKRQAVIELLYKLWPWDCCNVIKAITLPSGMYYLQSEVKQQCIFLSLIYLTKCT